MKSPQVGLEPTTNRLTADRSTAELLRQKDLATKFYHFSVVFYNLIKFLLNFFVG